MTAVRWDGLVSKLFAIGVKRRPVPVGLAIIFQLEGVAADKYLRGTYEAAQHLLIVLDESLIHSIGSVARHDQQYGNGMFVATRFFCIVGQVLSFTKYIKCYFNSLSIFSANGTYHVRTSSAVGV